MGQSFREYVEARDQPMPQDSIENPVTKAAKPVVPMPPMPGALRTAQNRFGAAWDSMNKRDPKQMHDKFTNPRRVKANIISNVQPYTSLANDDSELRRIKNNSMYAMNRLFSAERRRLKQQNDLDV